MNKLILKTFFPKSAKNNYYKIRVTWSHPLTQEDCQWNHGHFDFWKLLIVSLPQLDKITNLNRKNVIIYYSEIMGNRGLEKLDEIANNANIGIRGFTRWKQKKSSNKMLPLVGIEPLA